jgi:hypothetical protein
MRTLRAIPPQKARRTIMSVESGVSITAVQLAHGGFERMECLPRHFGRAAVLFENAVYVMAERLCPEYRGGFWQFYELSNGGFYMTPELGAETVAISVETNGYNGRMSCDAAGVTICLFVFSHLSFASSGECWARHFHQLRDFAVSHREAAEIFAAID